MNYRIVMYSEDELVEIIDVDVATLKKARDKGRKHAQSRFSGRIKYAIEDTQQRVGVAFGHWNV